MFEGFIFDDSYDRDFRDDPFEGLDSYDRFDDWSGNYRSSYRGVMESIEDFIMSSSF